MSFKTSIQDALQLTRSQRLLEATQKIQSALRQQQSAKPPVLPTHANYHRKSTRPLGQVVQALQKLRQYPFAPGKAVRGRSSIEPETVDGAQFITRSFSCVAGSRSYKLYIPKHRQDTRRPLVIMLHGCKQNPSDFAIGTGMHTLSEAHGMLVAFPEQTQTANPSACWNWFNPSHQQYGIGEPAIIAGITEEIVKLYDIDRAKVFVAGLSAGGAMAVVMGETYPTLFSAVGVHSGLPYRSASDVVSAFAAMRGEVPSVKTIPKLRTIVFHGDADGTVAPSNGISIVSGASFTTEERVNGQYTRRIAKDSDGRLFVEHWTLHGVGHAWSGGNLVGSYTDANGPNASAEMIKFFLELP
jgi:poly(hydroxyalkanoate) depolymerase family esterase